MLIRFVYLLGVMDQPHSMQNIYWNSRMTGFKSGFRMLS